MASEKPESSGTCSQRSGLSYNNPRSTLNAAIPAPARNVSRYNRRRGTISLLNVVVRSDVIAGQWAIELAIRRRLFGPEDCLDLDSASALIQNSFEHDSESALFPEYTHHRHWLRNRRGALLFFAGGSIEIAVRKPRRRRNSLC